MMRMLLICVVLFIPISGDEDQRITDMKVRQDNSSNDYFLLRGLSWISDKFLDTLESYIPDDRSGRTTSVEGRKKKFKKFKLSKILGPLVIIMLIIKAIKLPLILKALAVLSGKAVLLSLLSLILSAIIGLRQFGFGRFMAADSKVDMVTVPLKYKRRDHTMEQEEPVEEDLAPYRYYAEKRRRRKR